MLAPTPFFADRGCHVRIYEEARAIQSLGGIVEIVTYHIGRDLPGIKTHRIPKIPWYSKLEAGPSWHKPYLDVLLFFKALSVARKFKPDLIHAHLHEGAFIGILLKKLLRIPLIFDCQGSLTGEIVDHGFVGRGSFAGAVFGWLESFINKSADTIITSSTPAAAELVKSWGVPVGSVTAVTDGVNTDEFFPSDKITARKRLHFPEGVPVAAFLGLFNRYQGVDLLLDVISLLKQRGSQIHFLLMGFPDEKYRQLAVAAGIDDMITFTGKVDYAQAPLFLSAADVALSPKISLTEANGKLFNYMACSLPSMVFETPVNREILGDIGTYASFADPVDFADKLEALLADADRCAELGQRSREKAVREHSWMARGETLLRLYRKVLL
ncbi:MAG: glycosyltransferase family 1 protein [Deltaproteobacteria bacterium HGW-Deltaproteobacteria-23]|nr:MAG: glycosyltransferase family 1 protein [Deltaproteobacteria bacterium HGW-Deltaproteobacteria-23]